MKMRENEKPEKTPMGKLTSSSYLSTDTAVSSSISLLMVIVPFSALVMASLLIHLHLHCHCCRTQTWARTANRY